MTAVRQTPHKRLAVIYIPTVAVPNNWSLAHYSQKLKLARVQYQIANEVVSISQTLIKAFSRDK